MARIDPFYRIHHILDGRRTAISKADLAERLECSERSVARYIEQMQTEFNAPIIWQPRRGYLYDPKERDQWQVPGLWMTREEIQSLLLLLDILNRFGNGLLNDELKGVRRSIDNLLAKRDITRSELERRLRVIPLGHRLISDQQLQHALSATLDRKRLQIRYEDFNGKRTRRTVSPQRLVYYRDNWYTDAWCHTRKELRTFAVARVNWSHIDGADARDIDDKTLDAHFKTSYGVFAGEPEDWATLRFMPPIATEISRQQWHPDQEGRWEKKTYVLSVPFSQSTELIQDVMKHLPHVLVEGPETLRTEVHTRLAQAGELYGVTG